MFRSSEVRVNQATGLLVLLASGWIFSLPLRSHGVLLGFSQDDFYYYLKTAQNSINLHRVTLDGSSLTNGFQPLYFVLLTVVSAFTQKLRSVYEVLWVLDVASTVAVFVLVRRIFNRRLAGAWLGNAFAIAVTMASVRTISMQMEVTLALPLGFGFLSAGLVPEARYTTRRCAWMGLLAALTMLSRLDAAFLPAMFVLGLWLVRQYRQVFTGRKVAVFLGAALPLPFAYFALNVIYFHQLLPISGSAKQLRHGWMPSVVMLQSFNGASLMIVMLALLCGWLAWERRDQLKPDERVCCIAGFGCCAVFYTIEMFVSDWKLWGWYFYMLRFALAASLLVLGGVLTGRVTLWRGHRVDLASRLRWLAPALYALSLAVVLATRYRVDPAMMKIQVAALRLNGFAQTHPGLYAMGDRAGMFAYVSRSPLLQTEGLMMDRKYLMHVRAEDDLREVLLAYGVQYYVAFRGRGQEESGTCFHAAEPWIAGSSALRMRSDLCEAPVYRFIAEDGTYTVFGLTNASAVR